MNPLASPRMYPETSLDQAGRAALAHQLQRLLDALPVALAGEDPEGVHDARVAIRRMRSILEMLGGAVWQRRLTSRLRRRLGVLARALGEVRDADVFLKAASHALSAVEDEATGEAASHARRRRKAAHRALAARLDAASTKRLVHRMRRFTDAPGHGVAGSPAAPDGPRVRDLAGSLLWRRYEALRAHEDALRSGPLDALHRLRVDVKRLRYALELFEDALGPEASALLARLVTAQDRLGDLHDAQLAAARVETEGAPAERRGELDQGIDRLRREAIATVAPILGRGFGDRVIALIAAL